MSTCSRLWYTMYRVGLGLLCVPGSYLEKTRVLILISTTSVRASTLMTHSVYERSGMTSRPRRDDGHDVRRERGVGTRTTTIKRNPHLLRTVFSFLNTDKPLKRHLQEKLVFDWCTNKYWHENTFPFINHIKWFHFIKPISAQKHLLFLYLLKNV